jgi:hypothetical protein
MSDQPPVHPYDPGGESNPVQPSQTAAPAASPVLKPSQSRDAWIWGIVLILVGGFFLLQNFTTFYLQNWWAVFILIPAFGSFANAWRQYQEAGRFSGSVRKSVFGGLIFTLVAAIFLFNLNFGLLWPILLIGAGLAVVLNALLGE